MISDKVLRTAEIIKRLKKTYPTAHSALNHANPFKLLIATILSAHCTDERDNRPTGFFRNKSKSIRSASQRILDEFGGEVPRTMDELLSLAGVARKTANVVMGNAFGIASGVVVDTHVSRLSQRLGLTQEKTPEKIELDLQALVPKKHWVMFSHWLIFHGRQICQARRPKCRQCVLADVCPSFKIFTTTGIAAK